MNTELLTRAAAKIKDDCSLMGSRWQNTECEVIAAQTVRACARNLARHGDAFSWLAAGATRGRAPCGTDNAKGLGRLLADGSLVQESYEGGAEPPADTVVVAGKPQILRVTDELLEYVDRFVK